jgi:hypothetical protein
LKPLPSAFFNRKNVFETFVIYYLSPISVQDRALMTIDVLGLINKNSIQFNSVQDTKVFSEIYEI